MPPIRIFFDLLCVFKVSHVPCRVEFKSSCFSSKRGERRPAGYLVFRGQIRHVGAVYRFEKLTLFLPTQISGDAIAQSQCQCRRNT